MLEEKVNYYIERLDGEDSVNAFHSLIQLPASVVPIIIRRYNLEDDIEFKSKLIEVIWQIRDESCKEFLYECFDDNEDEIWEEALNGIVALASSEDVEKLELKRNGLSKIDPKYKRIDEAAEFISDTVSDAKGTFISYQGVQMSKEWAETIKEAQKNTCLTVNGITYDRRKYGDETGLTKAEDACTHCLVLKGQYHVFECDIEQCPVCLQQASSCDCNYGDDYVKNKKAYVFDEELREPDLDLEKVKLKKLKDDKRFIPWMCIGFIAIVGGAAIYGWVEESYIFSVGMFIFLVIFTVAQVAKNKMITQEIKDKEKEINRLG